jgi:hypothetical protein
MPHRPPLDYDVSVTADKARRQRRRGMSGAFEGAQRICDHPKCTGEGLYRAPRAPGELHNFRWFCLDHIREYNASWNYFRDHDAEDLAAQQRADRVWDRPTWRLGKQPRAGVGTEPHADGNAWARFGFADPHEVLGENATLNPGRAKAREDAARPRLPRNVASALEVLECTGVWSKAEIRRRYRALVKGLHPDMNGGDRRDEGRLRRVLWAWDQIKGSRAFDK